MMNPTGMDTLRERHATVRTRPLPGLTAFVLLLADLLALLLAWGLALLFRAATGGSIDPLLYLRLLPALLVSVSYTHLTLPTKRIV